MIPEYYWFDGEVEYSLLEQTIDDTRVVSINRIKGSYADKNSRIWPFKVMRGRQPYDTQNKILGVPHLFGKDEYAYWKSFDWKKALAAGMKERGIEFSGEYGFVETEYFWPVTHMVAPAENSLACQSCHSQDGRLQNIQGIYIPGQNRYPWLDMIGWLAVIGSLGGVLVHGLIRYITAKRRNRGES